MLVCFFIDSVFDVAKSLGRVLGGMSMLMLGLLSFALSALAANST